MRGFSTSGVGLDIKHQLNHARMTLFLQVEIHEHRHSFVLPWGQCTFIARKLEDQDLQALICHRVQTFASPWVVNNKISSHLQKGAQKRPTWLQSGTQLEQHIHLPYSVALSEAAIPKLPRPSPPALWPNHYYHCWFIQAVLAQLRTWWSASMWVRRSCPAQMCQGR